MGSSLLGRCVLAAHPFWGQARSFLFCLLLLFVRFLQFPADFGLFDISCSWQVYFYLVPIRVFHILVLAGRHMFWVTLPPWFASSSGPSSQPGILSTYHLDTYQLPPSDLEVQFELRLGCSALMGLVVLSCALRYQAIDWACQFFKIPYLATDDLCWTSSSYRYPFLSLLY